MSLINSFVRKFLNLINCAMTSGYNDKSNKVQHYNGSNGRTMTSVRTNGAVEFERIGRFYRPKTRNITSSRQPLHPPAVIPSIDVQSVTSLSAWSEERQSTTLAFRTRSTCDCDVDNDVSNMVDFYKNIDLKSNCVWFKSSCACCKDPKILIQGLILRKLFAKESSLIIAKILDDVTIPETTSSRHLFFEAGKKFTKTEALKICSRLKGEVSNTIFHSKPDAFWNCNCVTYPVIETMPNNVLISQHPVEALHCVYDNGKWNAFCLGRKHAVFVPGMDSRQKEIWIFDQNYLFETVYQ